MSSIEVDSSPLAAARSWRGLSLISAARSSGLTASHAEALESGDVNAFDSAEEMIAAAVLYGASMGIGRDEALALLDRTVAADPETLPSMKEETSNKLSDFSNAVQSRGAKQASIDSDFEEILIPLSPDSPPSEASDDVVDEPEEELEFAPLDYAVTDDFPDYDEDTNSGELAAWIESNKGKAANYEPVEGQGRTAQIAFAISRKAVGDVRAQEVSDRVEIIARRISKAIYDTREMLRRSEHGTLIAAVCIGAVLIALIMGISTAMSGGDEASKKTTAEKIDAAIEAPVVGKPAANTSAGTPANTNAQAKKPVPAMIPPNKLTVNVLNAGSKKGKAKEMAAKIETRGYNIGKVTNAKSKYAAQMVLYPEGLAREARVLGKFAGVTTSDVTPNPSKTITIIVA